MQILFVGIALGCELCPFVGCLNGTNWSYQQFSVNINFHNWCYHGVDYLMNFVRTCRWTRLPSIVAGFSFCILFATGSCFFFSKSCSFEGIHFQLTLRSPRSCAAHTRPQLRFIYSCMYYIVHGLNSGLGRVEKYLKHSRISGPDETVKGWNSNY